MAAQNVRYAELTCTPYTNVHDGIPIEAFVEAVEDARVAAERDHGVRLRWIYDVPGEFGVAAAEETLTYLDASPSSLVGFGLGGPEIGVPRPQFKPYFDAGRARRPALGAARRRDDRAGDRLVGAGRPRRGAHRARHLVRCRTTP